MKFIYNGPDEHPYITVGEKRHITGTDTEGPKIRRKTPWGPILRSKAMWAIFAAHVAQKFSDRARGLEMCQHLVARRYAYEAVD